MTYDHRILQADTSTFLNSNMTNQAGAGDVYVKITWQTKDIVSPLPECYGHQGNLF